MNVLTYKRAEVLRERFGDLDSALAAIDPTILQELGCREETVFRALTRLEELDCDAYEVQLKKRKRKQNTNARKMRPGRRRRSKMPGT